MPNTPPTSPKSSNEESVSSRKETFLQSLPDKDLLFLTYLMEEGVKSTELHFFIRLKCAIKKLQEIDTPRDKIITELGINDDMYKIFDRYI